MARQMTSAQLAAYKAIEQRHNSTMVRDALERGTRDLLCHIYPAGKAAAFMFRIRPDGTVVQF